MEVSLSHSFRGFTAAWLVVCFSAVVLGLCVTHINWWIILFWGLCAVQGLLGQLPGLKNLWCFVSYICLKMVIEVMYVAGQYCVAGYGIGHESALRLDSLGFTVFAGCLFPSGDGAKKLRHEGSDNMHVIDLDVTSDQSVADALDCVAEACPKSELLAVVNNAGINVMADLEFATIEMYKRVAEVNLYGMIRVIKAFAPMIRNSKGRFVNVTSVKGRMAGCLDSTYTITKWAGEALSDVLRREMRRFGVKVVILEPGDFGGLTGMLSAETVKRMERDLNTAYKSATADAREAYGRDYIDALMDSLRAASTSSAPTLAPVIDAMEDAVTNESPKYRYLVDGSHRLMDKFCVFARLNPFLPEPLMDYLMPWFFPNPPIKGGFA